MIRRKFAAITRYFIAIAISFHVFILGKIAEAGWKNSEAAFRVRNAAEQASKAAKVAASDALKAARATQIACDADVAQYWPKRTA